MEKNWRPDIPPAMITDDIAFVGGDPVSVHLIKARDGLILLDTGYPDMAEGIRDNIIALGYDPRDVIALIHTHGHIDHYGGTMYFTRLSGAKTYIGKEDADIVTGERDLSWAKELGLPRPEPFTPDVLFSDGDVLRISDRTIRCVHAPGHTEGTYAFFIDTRIDGKPVVAAMHGGVGLNSMTGSFLRKYGLPLELQDRFLEGLARLRQEHVDVVLGNHPNQNGTAEKIARLGEEKHPFYDPGEWNAFLTRCEKDMKHMLQKEHEKDTARKGIEEQ